MNLGHIEKQHVSDSRRGGDHVRRDHVAQLGAEISRILEVARIVMKEVPRYEHEYQGRVVEEILNQCEREWVLVPGEESCAMGGDDQQDRDSAKPVNVALEAAVASGGVADDGGLTSRRLQRRGLSGRSPRVPTEQPEIHASPTNCLGQFAIETALPASTQAWGCPRQLADLCESSRPTGGLGRLVAGLRREKLVEEFVRDGIAAGIDLGTSQQVERRNDPTASENLGQFRGWRRAGRRWGQEIDPFTQRGALADAPDPSVRRIDRLRRFHGVHSATAPVYSVRRIGGCGNRVF